MNGWDRRTSKTTIIGIALAVAAGFAVFRVPLQSILVLGILLLCPLLMTGMHGGGHAHGAGRRDDRAPAGSRTEGRAERTIEREEDR